LRTLEQPITWHFGVICYSIPCQFTTAKTILQNINEELEYVPKNL
jgi:NADH:ubiquinone oxidoreductase subunit E